MSSQKTPPPNQICYLHSNCTLHGSNIRDNKNELQAGDNNTIWALHKPGLVVTAGDNLTIRPYVKACYPYDPWEPWNKIKSLTVGNNAEIDCKMSIAEDLVVGDNFIAKRNINVGGSARLGKGPLIWEPLTSRRNISIGPDSHISHAFAVGDMILGANSKLGTAQTGLEFAAGANLLAEKIKAKDVFLGDNASIDTLQIIDSGVFGRIKKIQEFLIGKWEEVANFFYDYALFDEVNKMSKRDKAIELMFISGLPEEGLTINYLDGIRKTTITTKDPDITWNRLRILDKGRPLDHDSIKNFIKVINFADTVRRGISRF